MLTGMPTRQPTTITKLRRLVWNGPKILYLRDDVSMGRDTTAIGPVFASLPGFCSSVPPILCKQDKEPAWKCSKGRNSTDLEGSESSNQLRRRWKNATVGRKDMRIIWRVGRRQAGSPASKKIPGAREASVTCMPDQRPPEAACPHIPRWSGMS